MVSTRIGSVWKWAHPQYLGGDVLWRVISLNQVSGWVLLRSIKNGSIIAGNPEIPYWIPGDDHFLLFCREVIEAKNGEKQE